MSHASSNPHTRPDPIDHVVLLLLENHSFDQMLGSLQEAFPDLDGIDPAHPGINYDQAGHAYAQAPATERQMVDDPQHELAHVMRQIADSNGDFVNDFLDGFPGANPAACQYVMSYYPRGFLPGLHALGEAFTICDRWHASLPGPTWPNRFFALSGTSHGRVGMPEGILHPDLAGYVEQTQDTLFDRLNEEGVHWKCYFHDIPQSSALMHQRHPLNAARYFYIDEFFDDARGQEQQFPQFAFIEPRYMGWGQNDAHPPHDIMRAEKLIADVYNALRTNEDLWRKTLLIVCYDEHGGFYDHVTPPPAPPPDARHDEYSFDRLGVRVPAILVSPWVERRIEHTLFDHTSVLNYLIHKWSLQPLGDRAAYANSIGVALTRHTPRTDTPDYIKLTPEQLAPPDPESEEKAFGLLNAHQQGLAALAELLARDAKNEVVEELPRWYAAICRWLARLDLSLQRLLAGHSAAAASHIRVSIAQPDRLSHHADTRPKDNFASYLMHAKQQTIPELANVLDMSDAGSTTRRQALHTLALITGRNYHLEADGFQHAQGWLQRHGDSISGTGDRRH